MKYEINGKNVVISVTDYFRARRINKHIKIALKMLDEYKIKDKMNIKFEYSSYPILYVALKYDLPFDYRRFDYSIGGFSRGYYSFGGYSLRFDKKEFYNRVIKPYTQKEYTEG